MHDLFVAVFLSVWHGIRRPPCFVFRMLSVDKRKKQNERTRWVENQPEHGTSLSFFLVCLFTETCFICSFWPAKHLSDVLTEVGEETWISSNSGCCPGCTTAKQEPLTNIGSRSTPDRHQKSTPGKICISHPLLMKGNSVCANKEEIWYFPIWDFFIFPAVFSHPPFIGAQVAAASFPPISPNALRTPLQCFSMQWIALQWIAMHFNAVNCIAVLCSPYCNLLNNYPLDIVLTIVVNPMQWCVKKTQCASWTALQCTSVEFCFTLVRCNSLKLEAVHSGEQWITFHPLWRSWVILRVAASNVQWYHTTAHCVKTYFSVENV